MIDLPDFGTPLRSIAGSVRKIAGGDDETPELADERAVQTSAGQKPERPQGGGRSHA